ncbi:MAG: orotate phosphoribosyltransferase-like protein [Euryarchaeota archaeon]|nr:orotate phosphoribosyltransferase-like protein [Euryarchaeota archaeon]
MQMSIEELRKQVESYRTEGLSTQQIADEMSLSQTTVLWLSSKEEVEEQPKDIRVGWRSIAVKASRIEAVSSIFCDIIEEECGEEIDVVVGISLNGIAFAQSIASMMDLELSISRSISEEGDGHISDVYADVRNKNVVIVDDVISSGTTMKKTINNLRNMGSNVCLCIVLANKSTADELEDVPLRGLVRVVSV